MKTLSTLSLKQLPRTLCSLCALLLKSRPRFTSFPTFGFQDQTLINVNIQPKRLFKSEALVLDGHDQLAYTGNLAQEQFAEQAFFINSFQQTRPLEPMDLNRCADGLSRPGIGSFIVGMHEQKEFEQKIAKERKEKVISDLCALCGLLFNSGPRFPSVPTFGVIWSCLVLFGALWS